MRFLWALAVLTIAAGVGVDTARAASVREKQSYAVWQTQDACAHAAFLKFPDYTPESNANRDRAARECEVKNHVPVRAPVNVSPLKTIPDAAAE
jgi:hypothetical protein